MPPRGRHPVFRKGVPPQLHGMEEGRPIHEQRFKTSERTVRRMHSRLRSIGLEVTGRTGCRRRVEISTLHWSWQTSGASRRPYVTLWKPVFFGRIGSSVRTWHDSGIGCDVVLFDTMQSLGTPLMLRGTKPGCGHARVLGYLLKSKGGLPRRFGRRMITQPRRREKAMLIIWPNQIK